MRFRRIRRSGVGNAQHRKAEGNNSEGMQGMNTRWGGHSRGHDERRHVYVEEAEGTKCHAEASDLRNAKTDQPQAIRRRDYNCIASDYDPLPPMTRDPCLPSGAT